MFITKITLQIVYEEFVDSEKHPVHDVPYIRMIRLTDEDDGPRVNASIQETRALRFFPPFRTFSPEFLSSSRHPLP